MTNNPQTRIPNERDKVREAIEAMFEAAVQEWIEQGRDPEHAYAINNFLTGRAIGLRKDLTAFCMEYSYKDWAATERHGITVGHKDAVTMLEALKDNAERMYYPNHTGSVQAIPLDELQKVITALGGEDDN